MNLVCEKSKKDDFALTKDEIMEIFAQYIYSMEEDIKNYDIQEKESVALNYYSYFMDLYEDLSFEDADKKIRAVLSDEQQKIMEINMGLRRARRYVWRTVSKDIVKLTLKDAIKMNEKDAKSMALAR